MLPFGVNCRLQLVVLGKKREEGVKPICFKSKATSVPQTNHSQYSLPVEALNLIVESTLLPFELHNLVIELHVPLRRKKSLQSYSSVDFDTCKAFDVMLRDSSSFGKLSHKLMLLKRLIFTFTGNF